MKQFVIALAITATAGLAFAAPHQGLGHRGAETLGLSDAQKRQIKDIFKADREKNKQLYLDARAKREELRGLKQANDPRAEEVKAQMKSLHEQVRAAKKARREQVLNVLTPEQRARFEQLRSQRYSG